MGTHTHFFCLAVESKGEMSFQLSDTDLGSAKAIGKFVAVVAFFARSLY